MSDLGDDLSARVVRGGAYLVARRGASMALQVVGVVVVTVLIGADDYGRYAGSLAFISLLVGLAPLGIDVYLVRAEHVRPETWRQAFTLLVLLSVLGLSAGLALALGLEQILDVGYRDPFLVLTLTIPVTMLTLPATALLERELRYRSVATVELLGDVLFYAVAVPIAVADGGVWAPVAGFVARRTWTLVATHAAARVPIGLAWNADERRPMVRYGLGITGARGFPRLSELANPVIVGHFAGAAAVGQVALAQGLVDRVSFAKDEAKRLALTAFARVQGDPARLERAHRRGTVLQVLVVGMPLAGFALLAPFVVPRLFGDEWPDVPELIALIGASTLITALFNLHSTALHTYGHNGDVILFRAIKLTLFVVSALVLVPWVGVVGFGWAQVARMLAVFVLHHMVKRVITPTYADAAIWVAALLPVVLSAVLPWPWGLLTLGPAAIVAMTPRARRVLAEQVGGVRAGLGGMPGLPARDNIPGQFS